MISMFEINTSATDYKYYTDELKIFPRVRGSQRRLITGAMDTEVRDIELLVTFKGVFEQEDTAALKSPGTLWMDNLLDGDDVHFYPDGSDTSLTFDVVPDISHLFTLISIKKGVHLEGRELRMISSSVYQPSDSVITDLIAKVPFFGKNISV